jgi:hypothetical protein
VLLICFPDGQTVRLRFEARREQVRPHARNRALLESVASKLTKTVDLNHRALEKRRGSRGIGLPVFTEIHSTLSRPETYGQARVRLGEDLWLPRILCQQPPWGFRRRKNGPTNPAQMKHQKHLRCQNLC